VTAWQLETTGRPRHVEVYADPADLLGNLQGSTTASWPAGSRPMLGPQAGARQAFSQMKNGRRGPHR
jgi:hypothetical protein